MEISRLEEQTLENDIQNLRNKANKSLFSIKKNEICEVIFFSRPPDDVLLILPAVFVAVNNDRSINTWDLIRRNLSDPNQFLSSLLNRDFELQPLGVSQVEDIKRIYDSHPGLTESAKSVSRFLHRLSIWLESSVEISLKQQRLSEIRNEMTN